MSEVKEYPKWIDHPSDVNRTTKDGTKVMERVLVHDAKEEAKVLGKVKYEDDPKKEDSGKKEEAKKEEVKKQWPNK